MSSELGHCNVCKGDASVLYPLLPGSPAFCNTHHNPHDAGPFGCDFSGPDDFDIPVGIPELWNDPFEDWMKRGAFKRIRADFIWTDKGGAKHKLTEIDDGYLANIINHLKNRLAAIPDLDIDPEGSLVSTEQLQEHTAAVIGFLEKELAERKRGHVRRTLPSFE